MKKLEKLKDTVMIGVFTLMTILYFAGISALANLSMK